MAIVTVSLEKNFLIPQLLDEGLFELQGLSASIFLFSSSTSYPRAFISDVTLNY